jgi:dolichol kinase
VAQCGDVDKKIAPRCTTPILTHLIMWRGDVASGLLFLIEFLPLFPVFAISILSQFLSCCLGESGLVKAISRTGNASEALGGPFLYCLVLIAFTLAGWRSAEVVVALAQMAVGDGLADIVGRKYGTKKWPWTSSKSIAGTLAFAAGGFLASVGLVLWFGLCGCPLPGGLAALTLPDLCMRLALVSVVSAGVELVPLGDDNLTVPFAALLLTRALN